jgi:hypothetical protein
MRPDGRSWSWDGHAWRPMGRAPRPPMPAVYYLLLPIVVPIAFLVGVVGEILARALATAVRVVIGVFALGAVVALLALFLTHT